MDFNPANPNTTINVPLPILNVVGNHTILPCTSGHLYSTMVGAASSVSTETEVTSLFIFVFMIGVGALLLIFGQGFEHIGIAVAVFAVLSTVTFVGTYAMVADSSIRSVHVPTGNNEAIHDFDISLCDVPLIAAIVVPVLVALIFIGILTLIKACGRIIDIEKVVGFIVGFTVAAAGFLFLFLVVNSNPDLAFVGKGHDPAWLHSYLTGSVIVSLVVGIVGAYVFPYVDIVLRCFTAAHLLSYGTSGVYGATTSEPIPIALYYTMFATCAILSSCLHLYLRIRHDRRKAEARREGLLPTEETLLVQK